MRRWRHGGCCRRTPVGWQPPAQLHFAPRRPDHVRLPLPGYASPARKVHSFACRIAGPAAAVLASKCLKGKPATVAKTGEACMLLIELEQQAVVIEAVLKAFGDKVPKVVLAAVDIIAQAVRWVRGLSAGPPAAAWPGCMLCNQSTARARQLCWRCCWCCYCH